MVILTLEDKNKNKTLMVGLSIEALKDLIAGKMGMVATHDGHKESLEPIGLSKLIIVACNTETDLIALIQANSPGIPSRIHPGLYS